jgi:hypothetical protein
VLNEDSGFDCRHPKTQQSHALARILPLILV